MSVLTLSLLFFLFAPLANSTFVVRQTYMCISDSREGDRYYLAICVYLFQTSALSVTTKTIFGIFVLEVRGQRQFLEKVSVRGLYHGMTHPSNIIDPLPFLDFATGPYRAGIKGLKNLNPLTPTKSCNFKNENGSAPCCCRRRHQ